MKKYITLVAVIAISLQTLKSKPAVTSERIYPKPAFAHYLHDAVWLIIKKLTQLELTA